MRRFLFLCLIVVSALLTWDSVLALCPSNGNTHVIYVTSNMGDNIWSFDTSGRYIGTALNKSSFPFRVDKLRDMKFGPGSYFYISSARGRYSRIFAVSGNGLLNGTLGRACTRNYLFTVTSQSDANPFLDHPYAMVFHPTDGTLFVANQNTVTITKYIQVDSEKSQYPQWEPVKNVKYALSNASAPKNVPQKAGLFASSWGGNYTMVSVRGLALSPPLPRALVEQAAIPGWYATDESVMRRYLLVCDIAMDQVHVFCSETGEHVFSMPVPSPVQVIFPSRFQQPVKRPKSYFETPYVYVTSKEDALTFLVPFVAPPPTTDKSGTFNLQRRWKIYEITKRIPQHASSGLFENPSHEVLLIADRTGQKISTFASPFLNHKSGEPFTSPFLGYFVSKLPDQPEFIMTTMVEQQGVFPFCYELDENGSFRYVALCTAAYIWALALSFFCLVVTVVFLGRKVWQCQQACGRRRRAQRTAVEGLSVESSPLVGNFTEGRYGATV